MFTASMQKELKEWRRKVRQGRDAQEEPFSLQVAPEWGKSSSLLPRQCVCMQAGRQPAAGMELLRGKRQ